MKWLWISPIVYTLFCTDSFLSNTAYDTFGKMQIAERGTRLWDISSHDRNLSHICLSLPAHRCYTAVCSEKEKTSPPVPPRGEGSLGKITFTHKVLMCLCEQMCVCFVSVFCVCVCVVCVCVCVCVCVWERERVKTKEKGRQRERRVLQRKSSKCRPEIGSGRIWKLGVLGGHQAL